MKKNMRNDGFTLVETIITLTLSLFVIAALMVSYTQYNRMLRSQEIQTELQGNVRAAMHIVTRTLTMTGYGLTHDGDGISGPQLEAWITWVADFDSNPKIVYGAEGEPDAIMVAGGFKRSASLAADMTSANTITLNSGQGARFNTTNKKLIYVGGLERARITSITGDTLTVSTHPSLAAGLHHTYPAGTPVDLIEVREFSIDPVGGPQNEPVLLMDDQSESSGSIDDFNLLLYYYIAAVGIEDLQIVDSGDGYEVELRGVASEVDLAYKGHADGLRRLTINQHVKMRNL